MTEVKEPIIFKFLPYQGQNEEIYEGYKTKISLYENRLEYRMKFSQKVNISMIKDGEVTDTKESSTFCDEDGFLFKNAITGVSKYIETDYNKETSEPFNINYVDIGYKGSVFTFSCKNEETKDNLYKTIYNWLLDKKEDGTN